jgi:hypothetical protein
MLKTIALLLFVSQCLLAPLASLHAEEASTFEVSAKVESTVDARSITVSEYVLFLKALAAEESEAIYNTRFQDQIDRLWVGDHFDYQVREGTNENALLNGLLEEEVECYYDWIEHGSDSQAAATSATDDKKAESSPLMMWRRGIEKNKPPDEKKSSSSEHLSPAERTDQARREEDFDYERAKKTENSVEISEGNRKEVYALKKQAEALSRGEGEESEKTQQFHPSLPDQNRKPRPWNWKSILYKVAYIVAHYAAEPGAVDIFHRGCTR